ASELERREAEVAKLLSSMAKAGAEEAQRREAEVASELERREAEVASEFRRRDEELAKVQAQKPGGGGSGASSARQVPSPPPSGPGPVGPAAPAPKVSSPPPSRQSRMEVIQSRLLSEVEALKNGDRDAKHGDRDAAGSRNEDIALADMMEQNKSLQARLSYLEKTSPADRRSQVQRLTFMEKAVRELESERAELMVRATVSEEQLKQLQRHLKEMTEDYQMQILQLKLQLKAR
ncbi:unnamed protein product, partial [Polarella glacialis]